jgi:hypothetical protein
MFDESGGSSILRRALRNKRRGSEANMRGKFNMKLLQQSMALCLSWCLILASVRDGFGYQSDPSSSQPPQAAKQSPDQLQQLVAPIALYPDTLIAQILAAATYPEQIVEAGKWMEKHKDLNGEKLAKDVNKEHWDASVKALTQFPAVLANMNQNLAWTSELGDAYVNQQQDVTQAIQVMRQRAKQAGNLKTTTQENVTTQGQTIVIQPAAPDIVYVPQYDPWLAYGYPLAVFPGWYPYPGLFWDGPGIYWGLGFGVGLFAGFGWGWGNWGFDWRGGGRVIYNHNTYISNSRTIVNRSSFGANRDSVRSQRGSAGRASDFRGRSSAPGMRSGAFSGFDRGGMARSSSFRGMSSFGGGGFHGGGFHGGGGRR